MAQIVLDVVPAATHEVTVAQTTVCNRPVFAGTLAAVHVSPPSAEITMAPCPCPVVVAVTPVARQGPPATHVREPASCSPAGSFPPRCQVRPKSFECADQIVVPSVAMTVQSMARGHSAPLITVAPAGMATTLQLDPASCVVSAMPAEAEPLRPTAMQSRALGHEIAVRAGAEVRCRGCATHVRPPAKVASITVAGEGGGDEDGVELEVGEDVIVLAVPGPGVPTAQQRSAPAHDTASS